MAGTRNGGLKGARTNKERHGLAFYKDIGKIGGETSKGGSFNRDRELARLAGRKGGLTPTGTKFPKQSKKELLTWHEFFSQPVMRPRWWHKLTLRRPKHVNNSQE